MLTRVVSLSWVPLTTSFVSLILAVSGIVISTREPEVVMILPEQIRVAQGEDFGFAYIYAQPAFVNTGQNDRVEVIRDMTLRIAPAGAEASHGREPVEFDWDEQAELVYDVGSKQLNYRYVADAVPLLVSPRHAQVPFSVFNGPKGWYFNPGTYRITFMAHRVVSSGALEGALEITLAPKDIDFLNSSRGRSFLTLPARRI